MDIFGSSALSLSGIGSGSLFNTGEVGTRPVFDLGSSAGNTMAGAGYNLCTAMGGSPETCGTFAARAGITAGQITSQQGIDAYNAAKPANPIDSAIYGGGAGDASTKGSAAYYKNGWLCRLGLSGCDQKAYAAATANGMSTLSWLTDPTRIVVIVVGIVLLGAGLFMLKSPISIVSNSAKGLLSGS